MKLVDMDPKFLNRSVNEGFSGGEKKRNEILQMAVLEPTLAILDETDSGLDIDALTHRRRRRQRAAQRPARGRRHHPLPAPAQLPGARLRARPGRRPHRRIGRQDAWPPSSRRRATRAIEARGRPREPRQPEIEQHLATPAGTLLDGAPAFAARPAPARHWRASPTLGFPTTRARGLEVHQRRAARARRRSAWPTTACPTAPRRSPRAARLGGGIELVFVNGRFAPALSTRRRAAGRRRRRAAWPPPWPRTPALVEPHLGTLRRRSTTTASPRSTPPSSSDGAFVHLPDGASSTCRSTACSSRSPTARPIVSHPRILIVAGAGSRATVVEQHVGAAATLLDQRRHRDRRSAPAPRWRITRCSARATARLPRRRRSPPRRRRDSRLTSHAVSLGAALVAQRHRHRFDAPGRRLHLRRALPRRRRAARRPPHHHRPPPAARAPAASCTRASSTGAPPASSTARCSCAPTRSRPTPSR